MNKNAGISKAPDFKAVAETLLKESDRGCVIFSASLLDEGLENLIRACCHADAPSIKSSVNPLFQTYAPLSTFSGKIQLCYAFRLIPKILRDDLELVRKMRNDFAHNYGPIDFNDPKCRQRFDLFIGPLKEREIDVKRYPFGRQFLTKNEAVERLVFSLKVAHIRGKLDSLENAAKKSIVIAQTMAFRMDRK
jgi:DNA-binding MltR family transcriptional regulator